MRKIILICLVLLLIPLNVYARNGSQWEIWTHSEDPDECRLKTAIWIAIGTVVLVYVVKRTERSNLSIGLWSSEYQQSPVVGFKITWGKTKHW